MIPLATQLGMLLRRTPVRRLSRALELAEREHLPYSLSELEAQYIQFGNPEALLEGALSLRAAGLSIRKDSLAEALHRGLNPVAMLRDPATTAPEALSMELLQEQAPRRPEVAREYARRCIETFNRQPRAPAELGWFMRLMVGKDLEHIRRRALASLARDALSAIEMVPPSERSSLPALRHDG